MQNPSPAKRGYADFMKYFAVKASGPLNQDDMNVVTYVDLVGTYPLNVTLPSCGGKVRCLVIKNTGSQPATLVAGQGNTVLQKANFPVAVGATVALSHNGVGSTDWIQIKKP